MIQQMLFHQQPSGFVMPKCHRPGSQPERCQNFIFQGWELSWMPIFCHRRYFLNGEDKMYSLHLFALSSTAKLRDSLRFPLKHTSHFYDLLWAVELVCLGRNLTGSHNCDTTGVRRVPSPSRCGRHAAGSFCGDHHAGGWQLGHPRILMDSAISRVDVHTPDFGLRRIRRTLGRQAQWTNARPDECAVDVFPSLWDAKFQLSWHVHTAGLHHQCNVVLWLRIPGEQR